jgi:signal transduction histidine kinase
MKSLRARLTFTHAMVAFIAVLIVAALVTILFRLAFERQRAQVNQQQLQFEADSFAERLGEFYQQRGGWDGVENRLRQQLARAAAGAPIRRLHIQIFDAHSRLLFDSAYPGGLRQGAKIADGIESPIVVDGQTVGTVVLDVPRAASNPADRAFVLGFYLSIVIGSVLAVLIALAVGRVISGRMTRPLRSLKDAARRLAGGARHEPLEIPPDIELAELAAAFNTMAAELEHQQALRRQLVADIAHELRTPLSVLRLQLESLEDGIEQPTPATLASLSEEVGLLSRLVDDLRLLSLADAGQLSLTISDVDAGTAIERTVTTATARARQQGVELCAERPNTPLTVAADPQRLAQILGNLVENALRYTPTGGQVTLRVSSEFGVLGSQLPTSRVEAQNPKLRTQNFLVFDVADTGPGIPPDELRQIFERFYRADKARGRETGGSGLGLAIVQRLVEIQGGRIWASSAVGRGTTFHVALPAVIGAYATQPLPDAVVR